MCGISFYISSSSSLLLNDQLNKSLESIIHRGPDDSNVIIEGVGNHQVGLGHNRLSIIELSDLGKQPMKSSAGNVISYNGEIYNHGSLRKHLLTLGHVFIGSSDTEVILRLYDEFGTDSFSMLKGMFTFVILDNQSEQLFVVRDTVGIKPIYLFQNNNEIYGSSEIRGLKAFTAVNTEIDKDDIYEFFNNGFLYEPSTGYRNIKKLMPGHYLEFNLKTGKQATYSFKRIQDFDDDNSLSDKINVAIESQQIADVPLGIFFSGGADSSILASKFKKSELFFAKYESDPSADIDLEYSSKIAKYLNKELKVAELASDEDDVESLLQSIEFVAKNTEEPISDYTFWATYQLSKAAHDHGYKVMLSGMGGDEAFAGYPRYLVLKNHSLIKFVSPLLKLMLKLQLFPKKLNKKFERLVSYSSESNWGVAYSRMLGYFSKQDLDCLFPDSESLENKFRNRINKIVNKINCKKNDKVKVAQFLDRTGFLSHNLMVSDKASMLASIELRVPLLDESVVAHGYRQSSEELIHKNQTKHPLKKILKEALPDHLVDRPKTGFNPPLDGLIDKIGESRLKQELASLGKVLNMDAITILIEQHFSKTANNTYKLWQLIYFDRWLKANTK